MFHPLCASQAYDSSGMPFRQWKPSARQPRLKVSALGMEGNVWLPKKCYANYANPALPCLTGLITWHTYIHKIIRNIVPSSSSTWCSHSTLSATLCGAGGCQLFKLRAYLNESCEASNVSSSCMKLLIKFLQAKCYPPVIFRIPSSHFRFQLRALI